MECQLCNLDIGEHTVTALGICGDCAEKLMNRIKRLEVIVNRLSGGAIEVAEQHCSYCGYDGGRHHPECEA